MYRASSQVTPDTAANDRKVNDLLRLLIMEMCALRLTIHEAYRVKDAPDDYMDAARVYLNLE